MQAANYSRLPRAPRTGWHTVYDSFRFSPPGQSRNPSFADSPLMLILKILMAKWLKRSASKSIFSPVLRCHAAACLRLELASARVTFPEGRPMKIPEQGDYVL